MTAVSPTRGRSDVVPESHEVVVTEGRSPEEARGTDDARGASGVKAADPGRFGPAFSATVPRPAVQASVAVAELDRDTVELEEESPAPSPADLHTDFLPFDRATLEAAIDQFLDRFDGFGAELSELNQAIPLVPTIVAAGASALASHVMLRRWKSRSGQTEPSEGDEGVDLLQFPGLPRLWCV